MIHPRIRSTLRYTLLLSPLLRTSARAVVPPGRGHRADAHGTRARK
jgi:hypothetical protein